MVIEWMDIGIFLGRQLSSIISSLVKDEFKNFVKPEQIEIYIKESVSIANQSVGELFYPAEQGAVQSFLKDVFSDCVNDLKKPLNEEGIPDIDFIVEHFIHKISHQKYPKVNGRERKDKIRPWLEAFTINYFNETPFFSKFNTARADYINQLEEEIKLVRLAGIAVAGEEEQRIQDLRQIFVMPDVVEVSSSNLLTSVTNSKTCSKFTAKQIFSRSNYAKLVLLGAPGSGKTILINYFGLKLAQQEPNSIELDAKVDWLPIIIRIRDLAKQSNTNILEFLYESVSIKLEINNLPADFFKYWLVQGKAVIIFDGLDEVAERSQREQAVNKINLFLNQYPKNKVIITSRPTGYSRDYFTDKRFKHYQILPFDDAQIQIFIAKWYSTRTFNQDDAQKDIQSLIDALEKQERIKLLAHNPLLLTIICLLHRYKINQFPEKRNKLYDNAVTTLLDSWGRNIDVNIYQNLYYIRTVEKLRRLMEQLAYWVHTQGSIQRQEGCALIAKDELIDQLKQDIKKLTQIELFEAEAEAERFISSVKDRTGLLSEQGLGYYAFVHQTFQEYLCAAEIKYQFENETDFNIIAEAIEQNLDNPYWEEVLVLLILELRPKPAAKAINCILEHQSQQSPYHNLLFAGRCLAENLTLEVDPKKGEINPSLPILQQLVKLEVEAQAQPETQLNSQVLETICKLKGTSFAKTAWEMIEKERGRINPERFNQYQERLGVTI